MFVWEFLVYLKDDKIELPEVYVESCTIILQRKNTQKSKRKKERAVSFDEGQVKG